MEQLPGSADQVEVKQEYELTFRDIVDWCIVFIGIPALALNVILWAIATTFPSAVVLPNILTLIVTLLLSLVGGILIVRYVDVFVLNLQKFNRATYTSDDDMWPMFGAATVCIFLAVCIVGSLSVAGSLEPWHYTLIPVEILLVGYQTWRTFTSRNK